MAKINILAKQPKPDHSEVSFQIDFTVVEVISTMQALAMAIETYGQSEDGYKKRTSAYTDNMSYLIGLNAELADALGKVRYEITNVEPTHE
jgi:predicted lipoprotein